MRRDLKGKSQNPIDDKGRVSLPAKYRKPLSGADLVLVLSVDDNFKYLNLFDEADYDEWIEKFFEAEGGYRQNSPSDTARMMRLQYFRESVVLDASNRIRIDADLRKYAGLNDSVVFIGMGSYVSLLSPEAAEQLMNVPVYTIE